MAGFFDEVGCSGFRLCGRGLIKIGLALIASFAGLSYAAQSVPSKGPAPDWVKPVAFDVEAKIPVDQIRGGVYYLMVDRQVRASVNDRQWFQRYAVKVVNEQGLEAAANVDIGFNPAYQTVALHVLSLHRNGEIISQLSTAQIRVLQRETDLEARVFDGRLTASILFKDVRVGDVVEYAYTVRGMNPVFEGRQFGSSDMQWRDPVDQVYTRLLWPSQVPITFKNVNVTDSAIETQQGRLREYEWFGKKVPGLRTNNEVPVWFDPYPYVQWSAFPDWGAVSAWAIPLYKVPSLPRGELFDEVERIRREISDPKERAAAALRYVQKNIRYLSVDVGVGSYKPSPPTTVMERRFGDCKDKTLLLLTMLKALGLDARAALANTRIKDGVQQRIPSPGAFDHVLVQLRVEGQTYWLDPTSPPQTGYLESISQPYFGYALVIDPQTRSLEPMVRTQAMRYARSIRTTFDATEGVGRPVHLTVKSVLKGLSAERMRNDMARSNLDELQRQYANFYAGYYPGIETEGQMEVEDAAEANLITVVERYRIANFWKKDGDNGQLVAPIKSPDLLSYLQDPDERVRDAPLALSHETLIENTTEVQLPEDWSVEPSTISVGHPAFKFDEELTTTPRLLTLVGRYQTLRDHVTVEETAGYLQKLQEARSASWLELTYEPTATASSEFANTFNLEPLKQIGWWTLSYFLVVGAICVGLARKLYRYDPPVRHVALGSGPRPLGGWLIVLGLALLLSLLQVGFALWPAVMRLAGDVWTNFHSGSAQNASVLTSYEDLFLLGFTSILVTPHFVQIVLFFQRRSSFPRISYWLLGLGAVVILLEYVAGDPTQDRSQWFKTMTQVVMSLVWCVYLYRSERSKNTFVRRYKQKSGTEPDPDVPNGEIPAPAS